MSGTVAMPFQKWQSPNTISDVAYFLYNTAVIRKSKASRTVFLLAFLVVLKENVVILNAEFHVFLQKNGEKI